MPKESISAAPILDRDDNIIGITLKYKGSPSENYVLLEVYCDHNSDLRWDEIN